MVPQQRYFTELQRRLQDGVVFLETGSRESALDDAMAALPMARASRRTRHVEIVAAMAAFTAGQPARKRLPDDGAAANTPHLSRS